MKPLVILLLVAACALAGEAARMSPVLAQAPPGAAPAGPQKLETQDLSDVLVRRDAAAVNELKRRFATIADKRERQRIAEALLSRQQGDQPYFDFLAGYARKAVDNDAPFPYGYDASGKLIQGKLSPQFQVWLAGKKLDPATAVPLVFLEQPIDVYFLALTGDPRGTEILLKGVDSPNYLVAYRAAFGLAKLRFKPAIPAIIKAAERAPGDGRELVARALVLFDDREAQAAAERLIKNQQLLAALRSNAKRELTLNIGDS